MRQACARAARPWGRRCFRGKAALVRASCASTAIAPPHGPRTPKRNSQLANTNFPTRRAASDKAARVCVCVYHEGKAFRKWFLTHETPARGVALADPLRGVALCAATHKSAAPRQGLRSAARLARLGEFRLALGISYNGVDVRPTTISALLGAWRAVLGIRGGHCLVFVGRRGKCLENQIFVLETEKQIVEF